ncbi:MAG TPA: monofunctional biosynthetic peptidoglycan transglycosylase [Luteibaculaceae bacterium]|nr:monofunctional biosynthetic peptidoglycan transglycosylase [Luteibaculaceae bacterium]
MASKSKSWSSFWSAFKKWTLRLILAFFIGSIALTLIYRWVNPPITWLMFQRWAMEGHGLEKDWIDIDELPKHVPLAMVAAEDQKFMEHAGFDFEAIEKAVKYNDRKQGKKIKGGSTISQQTAKNVFCWPKRSWIRKGMETYFTVLIEMLWPKKRILEVYVNVVELGPGIYGVEAASQKFWGRSAAKISRQQASLLAAVLPRPLKYNAKSPGPYVRKRSGRIQRAMNQIAVDWNS